MCGLPCEGVKVSARSVSPLWSEFACGVSRGVSRGVKPRREGGAAPSWYYDEVTPV